MNSKISPLLFYGILFLLVIGFSCSNPDNNNTGNTTDEVQNVSKSSSQQKRMFGRRRHQQNRLRKKEKGENKHKNDSTSEPASTGSDYLSAAVILTRAEEQAVKPDTAIAQYRRISNELEAMGKILANQYRKAIVSYPFPARVAKINARIGDHVKKGQKLMVLQSEEVGEATSAFYRANADFELAKVNFDREQQLFAKGVGAKKNFLTAEAELKVAEANLNAAEKKLHVLGFTEDEVKRITHTHQINPVITLYAPIGGKIVRSNVILGEMIDESTEILTIMDPSVLWVDAGIYEKDIARIKIGQKVVANVPAYPGESFMGKITYISDLLNESTRTITVRSEVRNRLNKLKPGMFASLKIVLELEGNALCIPVKAVLDDKGNKLVFVKSDGVYYPREVQVGVKNGDFITIKSGIRKGDIVVTSGNFQLKSKLYEKILKNAGVH